MNAPRPLSPERVVVGFVVVSVATIVAILIIGWALQP